MTRWIAPIGDQVQLLVDWLDPVLTRPGLTPVSREELCIDIGESDAVAPFEPFDALVGPVRMAPGGVVADVIPVEKFDAVVPERRRSSSSHAPTARSTTSRWSSSRPKPS